MDTIYYPELNVYFGEHLSGTKFLVPLPGDLSFSFEMTDDAQCWAIDRVDAALLGTFLGYATCMLQTTLQNLILHPTTN